MLRADVEVRDADRRERQGAEGGADRDVKEGGGQGRDAGDGEQEAGGREERAGGLQRAADVADAPAGGDLLGVDSMVQFVCMLGLVGRGMGGGAYACTHARTKLSATAPERTPTTACRT